LSTQAEVQIANEFFRSHKCLLYPVFSGELCDGAKLKAESSLRSE
jgi:hypothetical protein